MSQSSTAVANAWPFSTWSNSRGKRAVDLLCSTMMLVAASPIMLLASALIALTSWGPVFFRHERLGRNGNTISVLKFRTMANGAASGGPAVTRSGDSRVTAIGRVLRKWKMDELPQLINVVRGEMSMVGPRPDMAKYMDRLTPDERRILLLTPGITSPATLVFRNEEELLHSVGENELEDFYCTTILPEKAGLEAAYARRATFASDLSVLLQTAGAVLWRRTDRTDRMTVENGTNA